VWGATCGLAIEPSSKQHPPGREGPEKGSVRIGLNFGLEHNGFIRRLQKKMLESTESVGFRGAFLRKKGETDKGKVETRWARNSGQDQ